MKPQPDPSTYLPLREVELSVLLSVTDRPRHGYAVLQEADARTGGQPGFEIPTLYRALRRMRGQGLIQPVPAPAGEAHEDARREYWRATPLGRRVLAAELQRMEVLLVAGRKRLAAEGA
jgi:DNA-binding PadR family transcriptional regulator